MRAANPLTLIEATFQECFPRPLPQEGVASLSALIGWTTTATERESFGHEDMVVSTTIVQMWLNHRYVFRVPGFEDHIVPAASIMITDRQPPDLLGLIVGQKPSVWEVSRLVFSADGLFCPTWDQAVMEARESERHRLQEVPFSQRVRELYSELYRLGAGEHKSFIVNS
ncbi:MAG TPA: hypothetical protein VMQ44_00200 [Candidatus Saccharimonadales bacterium]|nr:hypothetical protein [Candidatus Saccharimonadales bacterium]